MGARRYRAAQPGVSFAPAPGCEAVRSRILPLRFWTARARQHLRRAPSGPPDHRRDCRVPYQTPRASKHVVGRVPDDIATMVAKPAISPWVRLRRFECELGLSVLDL